mgnify:CR=1 FL=1
MRLAWPIPNPPDLSALPSGLKWGAARTYRGETATHKGIDLAYGKAGTTVWVDPAFVQQKGAAAAPIRPRGRPATTDQPTPEDTGLKQPRPSTSEAAEIVHRRFGISADEVRQALEEEYVGGD